MPKLRKKPEHPPDFTGVDKQMRLLQGRRAADSLPSYWAGGRLQGSGPRSWELETPLNSQATLGLLAGLGAWPWGCSGLRDSLSASPVTTRLFTGLFTFSDVNECAVNTHTCSLYANCLNTQGSFKCRCKQGYKGNGLQCSGKQHLVMASQLFPIKHVVHVSFLPSSLSLSVCACLKT